MSADSSQLRVRVAAVALVGLALIATQRSEKYYDFTTYHLAGLLLTEGAPERAFDTRAINERFQELLPSPGRRVGAFMYSPLYLLPASWTTRVSYDTAVVVNQALTLAAILAVLFLALGRRREPWLAVAVCVAFAVAQPVRAQFVYQNWGVYLVALVAFAWQLTRRGRDWPAALCWALAIHLKLFVGLFLLPLAFAGRWRAAAKSLGATLALAVAALPFVGLGSYLAYGRFLARAAAEGVTPYYNKISLQAGFGRFLTPPAEWLHPTAAVRHPLVLALFWIGLPCFVALVYRHRRELDRTIALTIPFVLLFFPQVWEHTELLVVLLLLTPALPRRGAWLLAAALAASAAYVPAVANMMREALAGRGAVASLRLALLFYPALNLLMAALLLGREDGGAEPAPPAAA